jgi:Asp-tRNA(Asn)/Glu-tRNA(Gln) amidotransferase A subunit family amidase
MSGRPTAATTSENSFSSAPAEVRSADRHCPRALRGEIACNQSTEILRPARNDDGFAFDALGPNTCANYELGAATTLADSASAHAAQTAIARRFQQLFGRYDVILAPTTPVTPFPWTRMFASRVGGRAQENYYRWLALTYVTTLRTNPAARTSDVRNSRFK